MERLTINCKKRLWISSSFRMVALCWFCIVLSTLTIRASQAQSQQQKHASINYSSNDNDGNSNAFLTEDSVVLITGAAGFLGSELALALHRTYSPKRIICVDRMGDHPDTQEELALFEFQRQRAFNVMQTLGERGQFYRVDFSPMIPEYFDMGEVPVLDHIFRENPDISHVVHLADPFPHSALQAVPREKDVPKAGMMEALLEQLAKHERDARNANKNPDGESDTFVYVPPNFVYASSFEVYPHHTSLLNLGSDKSKMEAVHILLEEKQTLSTPTSLRGASKMMDEMIAKLYYDTKGLYSVGLRFFSVYGPWGVPGSPLFEMAERAITGDLDGLREEHEIENFHSGLNGVDIDNDETDPKNKNDSHRNDWKKSIHDFVYIDDAVDAMMAAMQFRSDPSPESSADGSHANSPHPIIFNVASGEGHSLEDVLGVMQEHFPPKSKKKSDGRRTKSSDVTGTIGSTKRAEAFLGYKPQVSLREGITKMLAWHYDRAFPYGGQKDKNIDASKAAKLEYVTQQGIVGCLQFDKECLRGIPIFPCASECSHQAQCTKSSYDEVIALTQKLTSNCESVLYTVDLDESLSGLPSANPKIQTSKSFFKGTCNVAFVSQQSLLVKSHQNTPAKGDGHLRDGPWVLVPLNVVPSNVAGAIGRDGNDYSDLINKNDVLRLLPKLSPGLFFGSKKTKRAIYVDPVIMIENIPKLVQESYAQPYNKDMEGATAMLIGRGTPRDYFSDDGDDEEEIILKLDDPNYEHQVLQPKNALVQNAAYRMVKISVSDNLFGDGFTELLDSRWIVHGLGSNDGRLFRCDVLGEILQWEVTSDKSALEFVLGLHDMWSRVIAKASGIGSWWIGENVVTVPEGKRRRSTGRRRLLEEEGEAPVTEDNDDGEKGESAADDDEAGVKDEGGETAADNDEAEKREEGDETVADDDESGGNDRKSETEAEDDGSEEEEQNPDDASRDGEESEEVAVVDTAKRNSREKASAPETREGSEKKEEPEEDTADDDESEEDSQEQNPEDTSGEGEANDRGEFVADAVAQEEVTADEEKRGDSSDEIEEAGVGDEKERESGEQESEQRDFSSYDTWMGILSSSNVKYFVRIVPSSEVGIVSIESS